MCLDYVIKIYKRPSKKTVIGYSCVRLTKSIDHFSNSRPKTKYVTAALGYPFSLRRTIKLDIKNLYTTVYPFPEYKLGFHAFTTLEGVKLYKKTKFLDIDTEIVQVKISGIIAEGYQNGHCTIVGTERKFIKLISQEGG
jgi:hypothetical protein